MSITHQAIYFETVTRLFETLTFGGNTLLVGCQSNSRLGRNRSRNSGWYISLERRCPRSHTHSAAQSDTVDLQLF